MKKLTISQLISDADKIKNHKEETKEIYIPSLDATITVRKPDRQIILDSYNMEDEAETNNYLVYECVVEPNLKEKSLHDAYGTIGYEVLDEIFDPGEVDEISKKLVALAGYGDGVKLVDEVKN